jgi:hypothetical protein
MKTFFAIFALACATPISAAPPDAVKPAKQFSLFMGFKADLAVVESNFIAKEEAISPLYEILEQKDPRITREPATPPWRVPVFR